MKKLKSSGACVVVAWFVILLPMLISCARFSTVQRDERTDTKTTVTTKASSWTFFDSKSSLSKWKATQSEKTQGASVGGLEQSASGTNAVSLIEAVAKGAVEGAVRAAAPRP